MLHLLGVVISVLAPAATKADAAAALKQVETFYADRPQLTATFKQHVARSYGGGDNNSGTVILARSGKMRWDYDDRKKKGRAKKSFISNGKELYVVEYDNKQYTAVTLADHPLPAAVSFLHGKGALATEFDAALDTSGTFGGKDDVVLVLTPKHPSAAYTSVRLVVAKDHHVRQSIITNSANETNTLSFDDIDYGKPVKDSWFEFDRRSVPGFKLVK